MILFYFLKKTLFFKNGADLESFYGVLQSIVERVSQPSTKTQPSAPLSAPQVIAAKLDDERHHNDDEVLARLGVRRTYKKGDVVVEAGDLIQRMFMIKSGTVSSFIKGHDINPMQAGDTFGYALFLYYIFFFHYYIPTSTNNNITE